MYIVGKIRS